MAIKRRGGGWATVHCHGKAKGRTIHKFRTRKAALAQHRAIKASQARRRKGG
jgi:hypothetical protein